MYQLKFSNILNETTVQTFENSTEAVNVAVHLQVMDGGYNTSTDWWYEVTDSDGNTVYADECLRNFE
ncbi:MULTISPECIES: hypothetical protein [unclassified Aliiroseovarius]|uniref:hypothetical protein n=1 Tax=unclassified Aliiroseovarius TaxID=2623558 RepID=UPI00156905AE|nr:MULTISPECIES: hypothetical protein [unclassified Aliiroseovarius]NRP13335.1 hypothetical protein [Aliiroseovarius sp. xm-d-517]NRP40190.1 hypothetical protein [Aliiroseovarius sp. xm-m-339-2]NRP61196.1 hypothetical protein [Aliiroseovarius sp. xm-a-151]